MFKLTWSSLLLGNVKQKHCLVCDNERDAKEHAAFLLKFEKVSEIAIRRIK
jgi:hypothetical protein